MPFSAEELEAMRLADAEIEQEFDEKFYAGLENDQIDKWLDELATTDQLDNKQLSQRRRRRKYSAAYRAEHKEEIAAKMAAYRAEHKEEIAAKMAAYYAEHKEDHRSYERAYMREYRKGKRRRQNVLAGVLTQNSEASSC